MKTFVYVALVIILGSFIYNIYSFNFSESFLGDENRPYLIGLCAGVCGLILCAIFLKYYRLKGNLENRSKPS
jgi:uncharacterized membrane protein